MLVLVCLFVLEVVITPELGVASSHGVGGFQQVVAKETIAGLDEPASCPRQCSHRRINNKSQIDKGKKR